MSNLTVENVYTRHKAKELAKRHFWKLLAMTLILAVIVYAISFGGVMLLNIPASTTVATTSSTIAAAFEAAKNPPAQSANIVAGLLYFLLMIVNTIVSTGLSMGLTSAMIYICCGGERLAIRQLFSRMRFCLKGFGLTLWVGLKTILWALPVYALMAIAVVFILASGNGSSAQNEFATVLLMIMPLLVMIAVFALVIPAYYRYMLSTYVLADKPDTGVFACVRQSKAMMKGHKWQAFKLMVPTALIMYVMLLLAVVVFSCVAALLADALPAVTVVLAILCILCFFALMMYYAIRIGLGYCIFYLNRVKENAPEEAAPIGDAAEATPAE